METHLRVKTWAELKAKINSATPLDYKFKGQYVQAFVTVGNTIFYANLYPPDFPKKVKGRTTTDADYTDFYDNNKLGIDTNPPSTEQSVNITQTKSTNAGAIVVTHNFCDPCTWYGDSVGIEDEVLADSGDGLTFNSSKVNWIDSTHGRITNENDFNANYLTVIKIDDVAAQAEETVQAAGIYGGVTYTSDRTGPIGNATLTFDGVDSIDTVVNAHNQANWWQKVTHDGTGTEVPAAGTVDLRAGDYFIDYEKGDVTFYSDQTGNEITASFFYENGSTFYLRPPAGYLIEIYKTEAQFSKNLQIYGGMCFSVWVYNPYDLPNKVKYAEEVYKNMGDFIGNGNLGQGEIPAVGEQTGPTVVFPFDYVALKVIKSSQGAEVRLALDDDIRVYGQLGTCTFYIITKPE